MLQKTASEAEYSPPSTITWNGSNQNKPYHKIKRNFPLYFQQMQQQWTQAKLRTEAMLSKVYAGSRQQQLDSLHRKSLKEAVHEIGGSLINLSCWCLYNLIT